MYNIILADPPWEYRDRKKIRKDGKTAKRGIGASNIYPVMKVKDIASLSVSGITDDNCALFLWTTWPHLPDGLAVMQAWGFRYVGLGFIWVKRCLRADKPFYGVGCYTASNSEPCLLGIKGKMKPDPHNNVGEVVVYEPHPRGPDKKIIHSRKPVSVRELIVELFGDVPRIELFAREKTPGWDVWGNEVESDVELSVRRPPEQLLLSDPNTRNMRWVGCR